MRELTEREIDVVAGGVPFALIGVGVNLTGRFVASPVFHHMMRSLGLISGTYEAAVAAGEGREARTERQ